ncbi:hypothetical protein FB451DRAFT_1133590 [Mycena latifolia]|nr:hypothetical protein FB451DRAFT_1133590 [Mycena latifolia]
MPTTGQSAGKVLKRCVASESWRPALTRCRANPGTIQDKFLVGYQGWCVTCANDGPPIGEGHHGWLHWLNQPLLPPANGRPNTDLWPDTSAYDATELYPVEGLAHRDGSPAKVFSSRDPRTVRRHFHWMAEHGVDGVFLQRFVGQVDPQEAGNRDARYGGTRRLRDEVGRRVREAAEAEGRVWAIMYDVSGVPAADVLRIITQDIAHLVHDERILESPAYLRERGRPVVAVWGFGLSDSPVPPQTARAVFAALRAAAGNVYIFAGVPSHWRTPGAGDSHADPAWPALWLGDEGAVDAISPWSVGRYSTGEEVERWAAERWAGDAELIAQLNEEIELSGGGGRKVDYVPVVLPGGSGFNLSEGKWGFNNIKRNGGKFLWAQIFHAKRLKGVRSMYGAMWDEYDEGTAFLPVVEKKRLLPESEKWPFLALDEDGYDIPSDWYMRIAGFAAEGLRSERRIHDSFPSKELQDYWSTRPRYEDAAAASSSASAGSAGASGSGSASAGGAKAETDAEREAKAQFDAWSEEQRRKEAEGEDAPPPAYSLEDEGPGAGPHQQYAPPSEPPQQQHTGGSGSYPPQGGYQQQQHTGGSSSSYQHPQHTGGSASSAHPGQAPPPGRPASAYPGQTARPNPSYPPQAGTAGAGLGRTSASLSARLPSAMYSPQARPASAAPGPGAGYTPPPQASGSGYPQQHASLAPGPHARPECARPTTPGAGYAPPHQHAPPPQQHAPHAPYASQLPAPKPSPTPNNASYPGAAYQHGAPPSVSLPSPDIPGPAFPGGGAPYQQSPPAGYSPQSYPGSQGFPAPQPGGSPYPSTGPGPSFPQENGYFYQQPPQPQFPNASGYSPPQPDVYNPNYAPPQQPQGQGWAPSMPHPVPQPGYGQQPQQYGQQPGSYGYSFPTAQPASGPLGFATTSVDKIVGRRTRQQLEGTVETFAQCEFPPTPFALELVLIIFEIGVVASNKLLSKFGL